MDKFVRRYANAEDALPTSWKTSPLPRSTPKRPVGRPKKRSAPVDTPDVSARKRLAFASSCDGSTSVTQDLCDMRDTRCDMTGSEDVTSSDVSACCEGTTSDVTCVESGLPVPSKIRGHYKSYTLQEKADIVEYGKLHGLRAAARAFKVGFSTVQGWSKMDFSVQRSKKGHLQRPGRPITYDDAIEEELLSYVLQERNLHNSVSVDDLCVKALELVATSHPTFKASRGWASRFMARHDLTLRSKTSMAQRLPCDLEDKIASFNDFVKRQRESDEFEDELIVNMDETPVYFDLVPNRTIDVKGRKSIRVRTTASDKRHLTVVLAVTAAGQTLPPMIIFKGKRELKIDHPAGWIICVQTKGWMDEGLMMRWTKDVLLRHTQKERCLLVLDSFAGHKTEAVRKLFRRSNIVPAVIPGGCTSKLQPLDVSINKPFKVRYLPVKLTKNIGVR